MTFYTNTKFRQHCPSRLYIIDKDEKGNHCIQTISLDDTDLIYHGSDGRKWAIRRAELGNYIQLVPNTPNRPRLREAMVLLQATLLRDAEPQEQTLNALQKFFKAESLVEDLAVRDDLQ